ncbi:hypothetical protein LAZ40_00965 [Cereibacter sphaeroides]|uniref:hypothetical protein n=1 Tax=Cereibacter sphaeroides TaxID=1063 RepID=UPI001F2AB70D|nr:hypothetical protein [Cereibacter sphaeroides]MCE6957641.1 hypothetical protein [Cereibacter sphaeroides]MCE6971223.1 hypothetical protein [Cereibacter sphaeroides]
MTGLSGPTTITVTGSDARIISIGSGAYDDCWVDYEAAAPEATGTVQEGDRVVVALYTGPDYEAHYQAQVTIGNVTRNYDVTTMVEPYQVTFDPQYVWFPYRLGVPFSFDAAPLVHVTGGPKDMDETEKLAALRWDMYWQEEADGFFLEPPKSSVTFHTGSGEGDLHGQINTVPAVTDNWLVFIDACIGEGDTLGCDGLRLDLRLTP